jgi:hypothetical protein
VTLLVLAVRLWNVLRDNQSESASQRLFRLSGSSHLFAYNHHEADESEDDQQAKKHPASVFEYTKDSPDDASVLRHSGRYCESEDKLTWLLVQEN